MSSWKYCEDRLEPHAMHYWEEAIAGVDYRLCMASFTCPGVEDHPEVAHGVMLLAEARRALGDIKAELKDACERHRRPIWKAMNYDGPTCDECGGDCVKTQDPQVWRCTDCGEVRSAN